MHSPYRGIYLDSLDSVRTSYLLNQTERKANEAMACSILKFYVLFNQKPILSQTQFFDSSTIINAFKDPFFNECLKNNLLYVRLYNTTSIKQALINALSQGLESKNENHLFFFSSISDFQHDSSSNPSEKNLNGKIDIRREAIEYLEGNRMNIPSASSSIVENYLDSIIYLSHHLYTLPALTSSVSSSSSLHKCLNQLIYYLKGIPSLCEEYNTLQDLYTEAARLNSPDSRSTYYTLIDTCFKDHPLHGTLKDVINLYYNFVVGSSITSNTLDLTLKSKNLTNQDLLFECIQKTLPQRTVPHVRPFLILPDHIGYSFAEVEKKMSPLEWQDIYNCTLDTRYHKEREQAIMKYCNTHLKSKLSLTTSGVIVKLLPTLLEAVPAGNIILSSLPILYSIMQPFLEECFSLEALGNRKLHKHFRSIASPSLACSS